MIERLLTDVPGVEFSSSDHYQLLAKALSQGSIPDWLRNEAQSQGERMRRDGFHNTIESRLADPTLQSAEGREQMLQHLQKITEERKANGNSGDGLFSGVIYPWSPMSRVESKAR